MMYCLMRAHHKLPHEIYGLPLGAKKIAYAFMNYELEQRAKELSDERRR